MKISFYSLILVVLILNCDLHDRYPPKGSFCDIMENPAPCLELDFRNKILNLNGNTIPLSMINRVHYEFEYSDKLYELGVLGEHRIYIKELKGNIDTKEKIFHRRRK